MLGRAKGPMETSGSWISGNRCRECLIDTGIEPARRHTAPGHLHPCSRAGNTPQTRSKYRHVYYSRIEQIATAILSGLAIIIALVFAYWRSQIGV